MVMADTQQLHEKNARLLVARYLYEMKIYQNGTTQNKSDSLHFMWSASVGFTESVVIQMRSGSQVRPHCRFMNKRKTYGVLFALDATNNL